jgi:two-component system alkaline phosphatase synthesis response regulator PhoP
MTKILIAEDERDIRDLIVFTLEFGGYEVVATTNGAEAVELAPSEKPDLIMLDVRMPRMTGYEACVALKANPVTKDTPVIFLSAKGQETEVSTGISAGAAAYILKPFAPDHLIAKVQEALNKKETPKVAAPAPVPADARPVSAAKPSDARPAPTHTPTEAKPAAEVKPTMPATESGGAKDEKKEEPKAAEDKPIPEVKPPTVP